MQSQYAGPGGFLPLVMLKTVNAIVVLRMLFSKVPSPLYDGAVPVKPAQSPCQ
jgi:hypothetical protein